MLLLNSRDTLSLSYGYTIESTVLVDSMVGARHQLDVRAANILICLIDHTMPFEDLIVRFKQKNIDKDEALQLLSDLNTIGALKIKRDRHTFIEQIIQRVRAGLMGIKITAISHRSEVNLLLITRELGYVVVPLVYFWILSLAAILLAGSLSITYYATCSFITLVVLFISLLGHEYSHAIALGRERPRSVIVRNGWRIGILHTPLTWQVELLSSLLGPIVGAVIVLSLTFLLGWVLDDTIWISIGLLFAFCHLASLIPSFGDGWTIFKLLSKREVMR